MKIRVAALVFLASLAVARADQTIERVQQALKDQGFYYGEVTGESSANLTAAIRRYQIRNGLQVTGELNAETLKSLEVGSSASAHPATEPAPSATAPASPPSETAGSTPAPVQPYANAPEDRQMYPSNPVTPGAPQGGLLAGTPYQTAPPDVQHNVVVSAQIALARRGFYRGEMDGIFGSALEFSLRAYQARTRIPVTGRLDLETLAALQLLPRPRGPVYDPSRGRWRPAPNSPVHGEWVPEQ